MGRDELGATPRSVAPLLAPLTVILIFFLTLPTFATPAGLVWPLLASSIAVGGMMAVAVFRALDAESPLSPIGFPFIYCAATLTASLFAAAAGQFDPTFIRTEYITPQVFFAHGLFISGFFAGVAFQNKSREKVIAFRPHSVEFRSYLFLRQAGTAAILFPALYRCFYLIQYGPASWNRGRAVDFDLAAQLQVIVSLLPLLGVAMLLLAHTRPHSLIIGRLPAGALVVWATASLLIGTRDEILGPTLILLWAYHYRIRRISGPKLAAIIALGFVVLAFVGEWRSTASKPEGELNLLRPVASSTNSLSRLMAVVPSSQPFLGGETYVASLRYATPFAHPPTGNHNLSAALRFPGLIGYTAESGLGFSPVAEAYWNFGYVGAFLAPFLFGIILLWAHRRARAWPLSPLGLLYPVLLSRLPLGLRSDFVQQYKGVLLIMVCLAFLWWLDKQVLGSYARTAAPITPQDRQDAFREPHRSRDQ